MPRAIDPVRLTLIGGQERQFLLSMGGLRRLKQKFGAKVIGDLMTHDLEEVGVPILFEAMIDKADMTEDQLAEALPAHLEELAATIAKLLGASLPERNGNPPMPTPTVQ